jgi:hypothetical protein
MMLVDRADANPPPNMSSCIRRTGLSYRIWCASSWQAGAASIAHVLMVRGFSTLATESLILAQRVSSTRWPTNRESSEFGQRCGRRGGWPTRPATRPTPAVILLRCQAPRQACRDRCAEREKCGCSCLGDREFGAAGILPQVDPCGTRRGASERSASPLRVWSVTVVRAIFDQKASYPQCAK